MIHKIGPALAAGYPRRAQARRSATPLTAQFLVRRLQAAGLPDGALQCVVGPGASVGAALCADPRVRKISFTGSEPVGHAIARAAGAKRLTCELGSNAALVVLDDADVERAAARDRVQRLHERRAELRLHAAGDRGVRRSGTSWSSGSCATSTPCGPAIPPTRPRRWRR